MLHKVGRFNDIPKSMLPVIPKEQAVVTYQFTQKTYDSATKKEYYRGKLRIPPFSRVWVAGEGEDGGEWHEIGLLSAVDNNGSPVRNTIQHIMAEPQKHGGYLRLTIGGGNAQHDTLYQYLELASFNESNPNRDKTVKSLLFHKDFEAENRKEMEALTLRMEAMQEAFALEGKKMTSIGDIIGIDTKQDKAVVKHLITKWAEANPQTFLDMSTDNDNEAKAILAAGLVNGSLLWADNTLKYHTGAQIMDLANTERSAVLQEFADFVKKQANPKQTLAGVKGIVDQYNKKK